MKKIIAFFFVTILIASLLIGCGTSPNTNITLETAIQAYEAAGITVDREEKPIFAMIGAKDGVIFYISKSSGPVKIYEYASEEDYKKALKEHEDMMKDWPKKGLLVLETFDTKGIEIFDKL